MDAANLKTLYQQLILDHSRQPRNFRRMDGPDFVAEGNNPLCGDEVTVAVKWNDDTLTDIAFQGTGCAICMASASLMTKNLKSKSRHQVMAAVDAFLRLLTTASSTDEDRQKSGKLIVFEGVRQFPSRVKCATLPWHTLAACVNEARHVVQTE